MQPSKEKLASLVHSAIDDYCRQEFERPFNPANPVARLHEPTIAADEIKAAVDCLLTTRVTAGPRVRSFEQEFKATVGSLHAIAVNSGSSANLLAFSALTNVETVDRLMPGDEVIVPAICWATTVWPLVQLGLVPVFVDVDPRSFNIDPEAIERSIGPRTRAVIAVHVYGNPCALDQLTSLCRRHALILIEDCCQALGARFDGKPVSGFGRIGTFSFYYSHHLTTIEGGMCLTNDDAMADMMRVQRAYGWVRDLKDPSIWISANPDIDPRRLFINSGYNVRMTDVQAAIGSVQLQKLDGFVERRRSLAAWYKEALGTFGQSLRFQEEIAQGYHSWQNFAIILDEQAPFSVWDISTFLEQRHVETRPIICGSMARQPATRLFPHRIAGALTHSETIDRCGFSIGCHQQVSLEERCYVADQFAAFFRARGLA